MRGLTRTVLIAMIVGGTAFALDWDWQFVGAPMGDTEVSGILLDPESENVWYVSSWNGIYITRDGGASWSRYLDGYTAGCAIDPSDPSVIYAGSGDSLFRSGDKGRIWKLVHVFPRIIQSVLVSSVDRAVYVGVRWEDDPTPNGIYKSTDFGLTWHHYPYSVPETGLIPWDIEEDPANNRLYVATEIYNHPAPYNPPFLRSSDGGATWNEISGTLPWHVIKIQVHPTSFVVYALTEGLGLYRSSDFGDSWEKLNTIFWLELLLDRNRPEILFGGNLASGAAEGGCFLSTDGGVTFERTGLFKRTVCGLALNRTSTRIYATCYGSGIFTAEVEIPTPFRRGDVNGDGSVDLSDAICTIMYLFRVHGSICTEYGARCGDAADANDSGTIDLADPVYTLSFLFANGSPPPEPYSWCGEDPSADKLPCISYDRCFRSCDFSLAGTPTNGCDPLTVTFSAVTTCPVARWRWDFGDGTTSLEPAPTHRYDDPGVYTVRLAVMDERGSARETKTEYITVAERIPEMIPALETPLDRAVLDNGRTDYQDGIVWEFDWKDVTRAEFYHLRVMREGARGPTISTVNLTKSFYRYEIPAYMFGDNLIGWTWKVRAYRDGVWGCWSEARRFEVEPPDSDPPP